MELHFPLALDCADFDYIFLKCISKQNTNLGYHYDIEHLQNKMICYMPTFDVNNSTGDYFCREWKIK